MNKQGENYYSRIRNNFKLKYNLDVDVQDFFSNAIALTNSITEELTECLCGHSIEHNYPVEYQNGEYVMGSCCIKRFNIRQKKFCKQCKSEYSNNNCKIEHDKQPVKLCTGCRNTLKYAIKYHFKSGKYKGQLLTDVIYYDGDFSEWLGNNNANMKLYIDFITEYKQNNFY